MGGDGQVSLGNTVMKHSAKKVRKMHHDKIIGGFAGSTADAFSLFARFEEKLEKFQGTAVAQLEDALGEEGLAGLVNTAGILHHAPLEFLPLAEFRRVLEVNLLGVLAVTRAFLPRLRRARPEAG